MIDVTHVLMTKVSLTLPEGAAKLLDEYASFLSSYSHGQVTTGDVVAKLADRLRRDEFFITWQEKQRAIGGPSHG